MATATTIKREQVAEKIAEKFDLSKKQAVEILNMFVDVTTDSLKRGYQVKLPGFGTFKVRDRKARMAINPRTGEKVSVPATRVPRFTPGKELKMAVKS